MITSLSSKYMTSSYQSWQADNKLVGKILWHMQTLGYRVKKCPEYVLFVCFVALCPMSTAMVIAGRSVHLTSLFPGQA